jgi:hypothetical protein
MNEEMEKKEKEREKETQEKIDLTKREFKKIWKC